MFLQAYFELCYGGLICLERPISPLYDLTAEESSTSRAHMGFHLSIRLSNTKEFVLSEDSYMRQK